VQLAILVLEVLAVLGCIRLLRVLQLRVVVAERQVETSANGEQTERSLEVWAVAALAAQTLALAVCRER
jgi:uncharacterized membrane protein